VKTRSWLVVVLALVFAVAAARCDRTVTIGVDPMSDGAYEDAGDAGASAPATDHDI